MISNHSKYVLFNHLKGLYLFVSRNGKKISWIRNVNSATRFNYEQVSCWKAQFSRIKDSPNYEVVQLR